METEDGHEEITGEEIDHACDTKDETFEIISEKEKFWRDELVKAETSHINAEAGLLIADKLITLSKAEIKKEADKNAR